MHLNKTVKALAIVLPIMALSACSSNDQAKEAEMKANEAAMAEAKAKEEAERVKVAAMKRAQEIKAEQQRKLDELRSQHVIYFDFDQSNVSNDFADILDAHAKYLNTHSNASLVIEGHADERGTPDYNIALGERRAKAVETYLETMGVSSAQLSTVSYGEEKPVDKSRTESAFAKNRRAVLVYSN